VPGRLLEFPFPFPIRAGQGPAKDSSALTALDALRLVLRDWLLGARRFVLGSRSSAQACVVLPPALFTAVGSQLLSRILALSSHFPTTALTAPSFLVSTLTCSTLHSYYTDHRQSHPHHRTPAPPAAHTAVHAPCPVITAAVASAAAR